MDLKIPQPFVPKIIALLPDRDKWSDGIRKLDRTYNMWGRERPDSTVEAPIGSIARSDLDIIYQVAQAEVDRSMMMLISSIRNIMDNPAKSKIGSLTALSHGLIDYVKNGAINGWLYTRHIDDTFLPWAVTKIEFHEGDKRNQQPAYVSVSLQANAMPDYPSSGRNSYSVSTTSITIYDEDTTRRTIPELLRDKGWFKETPELRAAYEADLERFKQHINQYSVQYVIKGKAKIKGQDRWSGGNWTDVTTPIKAVQDEEILKRKFSSGSSAVFWRKNGVDEGFDEMPVHPFILFYHLGLHTHMFAHVQHIEPYVYDKTLRDKIILPKEHADLIDILTQDMDVLMSDIIEGKSGGTTILCKGGPGLGKTLTAEVYSEVIERPLYRVHSGQLGVHSNEVEEALQEILTRAQRWGAALLIDECDVYVRQRGNDIDHNAVVASFLRTLEYFDGLLFMTTNRADDVDDAIASRCIAVIEYHTPGEVERKSIWGIMAKQFELDLPAGLVDELVAEFPTASGRDIKNLLKLVAKFCRRKDIPFTKDAFVSCAQFRGLK